MKKAVLLLSMICISIIGLFSDGQAYVISRQTYAVPNSPFTIIEVKTQVGGCGWDDPCTYQYQYYLNVQPSGQHSGLQRIEYVGFRVAYQNQTVAYYQLFPNGSIRRLTDMNQALFEPSKIVLNPGQIGQYQLFSQPLNNRLPGVVSNICLNNINFFNLQGNNLNAWNNNGIKAVHFWAGYGFLTQKDIETINLQKSLQNDPVIKAQAVKAQTMSIRDMQWALAQGNMFQKTSYYKVYELINACRNNGYNGR